jgi:hypothetical protein
LGVYSAKTTTQDSEVLAEDEDKAAVDTSMTSNHTISCKLKSELNALLNDSRETPFYLLLFHSEISAGVLGKHVVLLKRARVKQERNALPRRKLALQDKKITSQIDLKYLLNLYLRTFLFWV